ncbi:MAG: hypothetical protein BWK80_09935 [Desulfobacteraceae bacterium IS3]|nr:MAG: hypothetical protein BWK80_09935 [Desulfobacteraceae bacterium IS3]
MTLTFENIKEYIRPFSLVIACDTIKNGALRIATPFIYPNGSHIDLFLAHSLDLFDNYILSDAGQTSDYLADMQFNLWATKKRLTLIEDICRSLNVTQSDGQFEILISPEDFEQFYNPIIRLAQACIRIGDLVFTQRLPNSGTFQEEIEEFLAVSHLKYEPDIFLKGDFDNEVKLDFRVYGENVISLVQSLSSRSNSHIVSNEIFRRWYDLKSYKNSSQFVTVYDQTYNTYRDDDIKRLSELSVVLGFPKEQEQILESLAA